MYKTKHRDRVEDIKNSTRYQDTKSLILVDIKPEWYDNACQYFDSTQDINGFITYLKGA